MNGISDQSQDDSKKSRGLTTVEKAFVEVLSTAEYTGGTGQVFVCLILSYSAIDTLGWLAAENDLEPVGVRFKRWVDRYMLPTVPALACTSEEIYAARCGVVHTMTPESHAHQRNVLRKLVYAWGSASAQSLQARLDVVPHSGGCVAVHLSDLTAGVRLGAAQLFEDAQKDLRLMSRIESKEASFFAHWDPAEDEHLFEAYYRRSLGRSAT